MCGEWHWKPWRKEKLETHWKPGRQQSETRTKVQFHVRFERAPIGCRRRSGATQPKQREACAPAHLIGQKPRKCTNVTTETDDGLSIPRPDYDGCGTIAWLLKREEKKKKISRERAALCTCDWPFEGVAQNLGRRTHATARCSNNTLQQPGVWIWRVFCES